MLYQTVLCSRIPRQIKRYLQSLVPLGTLRSNFWPFAMSAIELSSSNLRRTAVPDMFRDPTMRQSDNWPVLVGCFESSKFADLANCRCVNFIYSGVLLESRSFYIGGVLWWLSHSLIQWSGVFRARLIKNA